MKNFKFNIYLKYLIMKKWMVFPVIVTLLVVGLNAFGQDFPEISETDRIDRLVPPQGKIRMVLASE